MPSELDIRRATKADLQQLAPLAQEFYAASEFLTGFRMDRFAEIWTELLASGAGAIFVAESGTAITGTIGGLVHRDIYGEDLIAEEFFWFVRSESRGSGVRLYRAFEEWARGEGASSIQMVHLLDVMPDKVAMFYHRVGFKPIETRYTKNL